MMFLRIQACVENSFHYTSNAVGEVTSIRNVSVSI